MSKSKTCYVISSGTLGKMRHDGLDTCARCSIKFQENDIIATSTTHVRYCYSCATKIHLVTGRIQKDLNISESKSKSINYVKSIVKKLSLDKEIKNQAIQMIKSAFRKNASPSKNILGFASAAIFLSCKANNYKNLDDIAEELPVNKFVLRRNKATLQYLIEDDIKNGEINVIHV